MKRQSTKGFTLVEIIVVLVIIAILAATTLPALTGYINDARDKTAISETRNYLTAAQTIASELHGLGCNDSDIARWLTEGKRGTGVPASYTQTVASLTSSKLYSDYKNIISVQVNDEDSTGVGSKGTLPGTVTRIVYQASNGRYVKYDKGTFTISATLKP